jgi:DNA polymerase-3 subunit delta'
MNVPGILLHPSTNTQLDAFTKAPTHAVLVVGPKGVGKTHIAVVLAAQLLMTEKIENHAYYRTIKPTGDSITIEQIRELISFFRLKVPGTGSIRRVAVVEDADTMGTEAQNALLKLLEEPPTESVLILATSYPQKLLVTIRSRTQSLQIAGPDNEMLKKHFEAQGYTASAIASAMLRAGTDIAAATKLLTGEDKTDSDDILSLVKQALGGTSYDRLLLVNSLSKQKDMARSFTSTLSAVAIASLEAAAQKGNTSVERWKSVLQAAHVADEALVRNGNAKLVLTELMLAM